MAMSSPAPIATEQKSWFGYLLAFIVHTYVSYACAIHLSGWLVARWFRWVIPFLQLYTIVPATDWYLQHLEWITILPALVVGYVSVGGALQRSVLAVLREGYRSTATWAWTVPTLVLSYRMLEYHAPSSVLYGSSMTAVKYFFDIQRVMPTIQNPLASDPIRVLAQMRVTAPFYAGIAYSLGAFLSAHGVLTGLFAHAKPEESVTQQEI
jgi:hypothetical protein